MTGIIEEETLPPPDEPRTPTRSRGAAAVIAGSILVSRVFGIFRQTLMAHYLGAAGAADAFMAAFKISNILQNLFGEGALSASFIPVYANLLKKGDEKEAGRVAGSVAALLALVASVFVLVGVIAAPLLVPLIAGGFKGERRELTINLTRILFPGAGIFVISAWCLGVLNSHRKFLLPYLAPVLWNVVMIAVLVWAGPRQTPTDLVATIAWASVAGAALQFLVQLPTTLRLAKYVRIAVDLSSPNVRAVTKSFVPVFVSRGVVQISNYIDNFIASYLPVGLVSTFGYASAIFVLPVSLFGISVSSSQLPEMSSAVGTDEEIAVTLRGILDRGLRHIAYFVIPSAAAFVAFGDVIAAVVLQSGKFSVQNSRYTWAILAGAAVGLLASTMGRLYSSTYYALHDTRTPLNFAILRVVLTSVLGYLFALPLPRLLGIDAHWGGAGLTVSAGIAGWIEFSLLRSRLNGRIGRTGVPTRFILSLWASAAVGAIAGWGMRGLVAFLHPRVAGLVVLGTYGVVYLLATIALGIPEARGLVGRLTRRK